MHKLVAIVISFNPDTETLNALLKAIESQVTHVIIIDNGSQVKTVEVIRSMTPINGQLIELTYNSGVSSAINIGISEARKLQASHVICFDQDSLPEICMIEKLLVAMNLKIEEGYKVAAVGPKYSDVKGHHASPFVRLVGWSLRRIECTDSETILVDHLITSGCLISMSVLDDIGGMDERLFIDYVDTEWCLRAINKGYSLFGVGAAEMQHDLGDEFVKLFSRTIVIHSPLRNYYLIRNGLWLSFQPWVSLNWKMMDVIRLCKIYLVFSLYAGKKFQNWRMMTKGVSHAIRGKMGKYLN